MQEIEEIGKFVYCPYYKKEIESFRMCFDYKGKLLRKCLLFQAIKERTGNHQRWVLCEYKEDVKDE